MCIVCADGGILCRQQADIFSQKALRRRPRATLNHSSEICVLLSDLVSMRRQRRRRNIRDLIWRSYLDAGKTNEQAIGYRPALAERQIPTHTHTSGDHYFLDNGITRRSTALDWACAPSNIRTRCVNKNKPLGTILYLPECSGFFFSPNLYHFNAFAWCVCDFWYTEVFIEWGLFLLVHRVLYWLAGAPFRRRDSWRRR